MLCAYGRVVSTHTSDAKEEEELISPLSAAIAVIGRTCFLTVASSFLREEKSSESDNRFLRLTAADLTDKLKWFLWTIGVAHIFRVPLEQADTKHPPSLINLT